MPSIMATIGANATTFFSTMRGVEGHVKNFGANIKRGIGGKLQGFFSMSNLEQSAGAMLELGGKVKDISNKIGISTDAVQQWDYALQQNGSSIENAIPFFQKLAQARQKALEGNDKAISSFQSLGVSLDDLKTKRVEDIAKVIGDAFEHGDPQQLIAPLVAVGGKSALEIAALFREGIAKALSEAPLISEEDINRLDEAGDRIGKMKAEAKAATAPAVAWGAEAAETLSDAAGIAMSAFTNLFTGKGWQADEYQKQMEERDKERAEKREKMEKLRQSQFNPEGIADEDAEKAAEKEQKEIEKADKKAAADKARAEKQAKKDEVDLERDMESEIAKEEANNIKLTSREGSAGFGYGGVHAGMSAGPELSAMNAQLRTEEHLREIKEMIKKNKGKVTEDSGDVEYE
jgi:hypothetical protein